MEASAISAKIGKFPQKQTCHSTTRAQPSGPWRGLMACKMFDIYLSEVTTTTTQSPSDVSNSFFFLIVGQLRTAPPGVLHVTFINNINTNYDNAAGAHLVMRII